MEEQKLAKCTRHEPNDLTWRHQPNDMFWFPTCMRCGWIDTKRMIRELSFWRRVKILLNIF